MMHSRGVGYKASACIHSEPVVPFLYTLSGRIPHDAKMGA